MKRKKNKPKDQRMEILLKKVGYTGKYEGISPFEIPSYKTDMHQYTSNTVPSKGSKKTEKVYTGTELLGISTMHKSNAVPIRRDNKESAVETAQMRR